MLRDFMDVTERLLALLDAKDAEIKRLREELAMVRWAAGIPERLARATPITNKIQ